MYVCVCIYIYFSVCVLSGIFRVKGESDEVAARSYQGRIVACRRILLHKARFNCCDAYYVWCHLTLRFAIVFPCLEAGKEVKVFSIPDNFVRFEYFDKARWV